VVEKKAGFVCQLLYLQTTMLIHLHSRDFCGLGMESLAEFGVSARMNTSMLGKVGYVSFQKPSF